MPRRTAMPSLMPRPVAASSRSAGFPDAAPVRAARLRPRALIALLVLAAAAWGAVFLYLRATGEVQRHISAGMEAAQDLQGLRAEREWRAAVRLDPKSAAAWELLGEYYLSADKQGRARDAFQHVLSLRPGDSGVEARLAGCCLKTGDEVAALRYAQDALRGAPNDVEALTVAATTLDGLDDEKRRLDCLRRLAALRPEDAPTLTRLAVALSRNQLYVENEALLGRVLRLDPSDSVAYSLHGEAEFNLDPSPAGLARAEADFRQALRLDPSDAFAHLSLARIAEREGRPTRALPLLLAAARLRPDQPDPYFELAGAYERLGQAGPADAARKRFAALRAHADRVFRLEKQAAVDPQDFDARLQRGLLALDDGDYRRASFYLYGAHALRPGDARAGAALRRLADLHRRLAAGGR